MHANCGWLRHDETVRGLRTKHDRMRTLSAQPPPRSSLCEKQEIAFPASVRWLGRQRCRLVVRCTNAYVYLCTSCLCIHPAAKVYWTLTSQQMRTYSLFVHCTPSLAGYCTYCNTNNWMEHLFTGCVPMREYNISRTFSVLQTFPVACT